MKRILQEIRQQPIHIRHLFMWSMVVIVFSFFGFWYFRSAQRTMVGMLKSDPSATEPVTAQNDTSASPFAAIKNSWESMRANISEILTGSPDEGDSIPPAQVQQDDVAPQKLPVQ